MSEIYSGQLEAHSEGLSGGGNSNFSGANDFTQNKRDPCEAIDVPLFFVTKGNNYLWASILVPAIYSAIVSPAQRELQHCWVLYRVKLPIF